MVRYEVAFKLSKECDLYKQYMEAEAEREKINELVKVFAMKHFGSEKLKYRITETLFCDVEFVGQVCKQKSGNLYRYKKNSALQKAWEQEVYGKADFKKTDILHFWYWGLIDRGSYSLWSKNGEVYGYLSSADESSPKLPDGAIEIKMSEYYRIVEE